MIDQTLNNRYKVTALLGKGAMGEVYRATDTQTGQEVAIKVITQDLAFDQEMLERFRREGEALRQLRHPNIVGFVDMFQSGNRQAIVMEYVPGGNLHALIKQGPLPLERVRQISLDLCDALTRAHRLDIVHRDLKPENVLIAEDGTPKLTDFGVARLIGETSRLTGTGALVGTPFYMSPEAWQGRPLDGQADIWSLGVMLFEMLAGKVPFSGDTLPAVMNQVLTAPVPDLRALRPDTPPALLKIVQRMLTRDKAKRYSSMREVALDLERLAKGTESKESEKAPPIKEDRRGKDKGQARAKIVGGLSKRIVIGAVIVSLLGIGGLAAVAGAGAWMLTRANLAVQTTQTALALALAPPQPLPSTTATVHPNQTLVPGTVAPAFRGDSLFAPDCAYGGEFKSIEAVDEFTVKMSLCSPDAAFPAKVAFAAFPILSKTYLDSTGGDSAQISAKPIGTGPYVVKEWVRGDHLTFQANPNYWGERPKTKTIIFKWSPVAAQRLLALQSGAVDGIDNPAPEDIANVEKDSTLKLYPRPALDIFYLGLNNTVKPLDIEKVRQAIAMALDKQRIVDNFYPVGSTISEQFLPPAIKPGYSATGDGAKWYAYDPVAAKKLLAEAGFPDGFNLTLSYRDAVRGYLPQASQVAQDIKAQLADIGIKITLNVEETGAFLQSLEAGKEAFFMLGWTADYPDAINFLDVHFTGGVPNFGSEYPDLVQEITAAAALSDPAERQMHYDQANALIKQHVPVIPIANGGSAVVFKAEVTGAHASPLTNERFAVMANGTDPLVWMQSAEPVSLFCGDEADRDTLRACAQTYESLLSYKVGGVEVQPSLAKSYDANKDLTEWTFHLNEGVRFHDGTVMNANDVVASYVAQWDAKNKNHRGNTGAFEYFLACFGAFLNAPPK